MVSLRSRAPRARNQRLKEVEYHGRVPALGVSPLIVMHAWPHNILQMRGGAGHRSLASVSLPHLEELQC